MIDSHCHLCDNELFPMHSFYLDEAKKNNVLGMLVIASEIEEIENLNVLLKHQNIYGAFGYHPQVITNTIDLDFLKTILNAPKMVGLGEIGLDYIYNADFKLKQQEAFYQQLELSSQLNKPVIIHTRGADLDTEHILKNSAAKYNIKGELHCYTGSKELLKVALDLGFYISFSGILTFKNANAVRDLVHYVPLDRVLIETDSPYLAPVPFRGKTNHPALVKYVLNCLADLYAIPIERLDSITTENFNRLFLI